MSLTLPCTQYRILLKDGRSNPAQVGISNRGEIVEYRNASRRIELGHKWSTINSLASLRAHVLSWIAIQTECQKKKKWKCYRIRIRAMGRG